jgi:hypothetical protein
MRITAARKQTEAWTWRVLCGSLRGYWNWTTRRARDLPTLRRHAPAVMHRLRGTRHAFALVRDATPFWLNAASFRFIA